MNERKGRIMRSPNLRDKIWSENSEQGLLAAMMVDEDSRMLAFRDMKKEYLYRHQHRQVFDAMQTLMDEDGGFDTVTLADKLIERGELESVGGYKYLATLIDFVPSAKSMPNYIDNIISKHTMREVLNACRRIENEIEEDPEMSSDMLLACAETAIFDLGQGKSLDKDVLSTKELMMPVLEDIWERMNTDGLAGIPTGFSRMDRMLGGLRGGQLLILAGRPGMGKTALALNIATKTALCHNTGVAIFSLEMGDRELMERMMSSEGEVNLNGIRNGNMSEDEMSAMGIAAGNLSEAPIFISDSVCQTPGEIHASLRRIMMKNEIGLVIIDYLQLMESGIKELAGNRVQDVSKISRTLKNMARTLDVPILALSQLNRGVEQRDNKRPILSDLRESGAIEQDADVVMFLFREEQYIDGVSKINSKGEDVSGKAELIVGKQRNGQTGKITMDFVGEQVRFTERAYN